MMTRTAFSTTTTPRWNPTRRKPVSLAVAGSSSMVLSFSSWAKHLVGYILEYATEPGHFLRPKEPLNGGAVVFVDPFDGLVGHDVETGLVNLGVHNVPTRFHVAATTVSLGYSGGATPRLPV